MNESSEQRGLFSRLPVDPDYWEKLGTRIADDARPILRAYRQADHTWWSAFARFSTALAVGAAAASVAALLLMPSGVPAPPETVRPADTYGLTPNDPMAVTLVAGAMPPSLETLLALRTAEGINQ